jgi:hypothetical protein
MSNLVVVSGPVNEPIDLTTAKNFLRVSIDDDDLLIGLLITAARETAEVLTGRSIATKTYRQTMDSFPYFADSMFSQQAMPPAYYSRPLYATTMWNYSQMIKLYAPRCIAVNSIKYVDPNNVLQTLDPTKYIVDTDAEPARLFPGPAGGNWPACLYVPNAVQIEFVAGYDTPPSADATIPKGLMTLILLLLSGFYENREPSVYGSVNELPYHLQALVYANRIIDVAPTRG